jgi:hypothetical protein
MHMGIVKGSEMAEMWEVISNSGQHAVFENEGMQIDIDKPRNPFFGEMFSGCHPGQLIGRGILEDFLGKKLFPKPKP